MNNEEKQKNYELAEKLISEQNFAAAVIAGAVATVLAAAAYGIIVATWNFSYRGGRRWDCNWTTDGVSRTWYLDEIRCAGHVVRSSRLRSRQLGQGRNGADHDFTNECSPESFLIGARRAGACQYILYPSCLLVCCRCLRGIFCQEGAVSLGETSHRHA